MRLWVTWGPVRGGEREQRYRVGDSWRAEVLAKVAVVHAMTEGAEPSADRHRAQGGCVRIRSLAGRCRAARQGVPPAALRWLQDWRNGGSIERAWRNLHSAEILLADIVDLDELSSQRPAVRSMARACCPRPTPGRSPSSSACPTSSGSGRRTRTRPATVACAGSTSPR